MHKYRKLIAWERSRALALAVYAASSKFPAVERFGITMQLRRAVVSAVANIAEGAGKVGNREFRRYLDITLGSLVEVDALLDLSMALGYLGQADSERLLAMREEASRVAFALKRSLRP